MDRIEQQVRLPAEAAPMDQYARTYAFGSVDRVAAYYFIPDQDRRGAECEEAKAGGERNAGQIALICPPPVGMRADERRWFTSEEYLPVVDDGGCHYIEIDFDLKRQSVIEVRCNGRA